MFYIYLQSTVIFTVARVWLRMNFSVVVFQQLKGYSF